MIPIEKNRHEWAALSNEIQNLICWIDGYDHASVDGEGFPLMLSNLRSLMFNLGAIERDNENK